MLANETILLEQEIVRREFEQKKSLWQSAKENKYWGLILGPFVFNQLVLVPITALIVILISFTSMDHGLHWDFVGWTNYEKVFSDPKIGLIFWNTVIFVCMTLFIKMFLGLFVAVTTTYFMKNSRPGTIFRAIWLLPKVSPGVVEALLWTWIFSPTDRGILNMILHKMYGLEPVAWLNEYPLLINIVLAGVMGTSITTIMLSSSIQSMDENLFRVAKVDGASDWTIIKKIIFPQLKWPLAFLTLWQGLALVTSYESILLLTDGGPTYQSEVWSLYSFHTAFSTLDFGYGSAISMYMLPLIFAVIFIAYKQFGLKKLMDSDK
ncbi:carbohydrate ABC transporter permease [Bacillus sp. T33-2]|uniref:carbohydrate ABC transporter permease n=1 Tax=Bacillus sp. T33-2 TaxID=2054168 RepID=UPI000C78B0CA|nr:sugar ABC transporter permease [Bacillus sp. T33-2]PLR95789.1 ABC transporter [Bacillus sp. T33-2]